MRRTMVLAIDYPEDKKERVEELLRPLTEEVNLNYGEVWCPYNGYSCGDLDEILEHVTDEVIERLSLKTKLAIERARLVRDELIARKKKKIDTADRSTETNSS